MKTDRGENYMIMNFTACILHLILLRVIKSGRMRLVGHGARMGKVFTGFWLGGLKVRDHWEDLGVGGRITLRWTLEWDGSIGRTGFGWLEIGSSGGLLWSR